MNASTFTGSFLKKALIAVIGLIVLIPIVGFIYYFSITRRPLPKISGTIRAAGLKEQVEIIRDPWGVPHIYAKNAHDLFYAQGYTQAQDRWWQMEFFRHTCGGRIEELTGKKAKLVGADIYLRSLGLYRVCEREYKGFTPEERAPLDAFAEGVNAYIANRSPGRLSVNYAVLGFTGVKFKIRPWTPVDSLVFSKLMAWDLGLSRDPEKIRVKLREKLGPAMTEQWLLPPWPEDWKTTILLEDDIRALGRSFAGAFGGTMDGMLSALGRADGAVDARLPDLDFLAGGQEGAGSNSWVARGPMTKNGGALLANDPHLGIQMPSIWYEVALHCPDDGTGRPYDAAGFTFSPIPGVVVGHNSHISWGTTNVYPDVNDQYMIKVNPANPLQYQWNGQWRDMTVREETIVFGNGKPSLTVKVRVTHLGPIINDNRYNPETGKLEGFNNKDPLALRWTALEPGRIAPAIIGLNRARNWDEFRKALRDWDSPSQSIVYADTKGNIGYQMPGRIPVRPAGYAGQTPAPGWDSRYEWKGYIPYELLPRAYNPPRDFIVASNQEVAPPSYYTLLNRTLGPGLNADFGSRYNKWNFGYRGERIYELVKKLAPHSIETYKAIQRDNKFIAAGELLKRLAALSFEDRELADARDWLLKWDRFFNEDSPHAVLYSWFWMKLNANVFQNKLGDIAKAEAGDREMRAVQLLLERPGDKWWDDPATKDITENRDDTLARSFREGYAAAAAGQGKNREKWRWGKLHRAVFASNPLGLSGIGPIESMVNRGPAPVDGNTECVNSNMWFASKGDFAPRSIPSMRMVVDMSDLTKSVCINSTGQSGHPKSRWYGDMIESWSAGDYHPMLWTRGQVEEKGKHRLYLAP